MPKCPETLAVTWVKLYSSFILISDISSIQFVLIDIETAIEKRNDYYDKFNGAISPWSRSNSENRNSFECSSLESAGCFGSFNF